MKTKQQQYKDRVVGGAFIGTILVTTAIICALSPYNPYTDNTIVSGAVQQSFLKVAAIEVPKPTVIPTVVTYDIVENARQVITKRSLSSPYLEGNRLENIYNMLDHNDNKFKIMLAISGKESAFGTSSLAKNCNNYWGYLYTGTSKPGCYSPRWSTPDKAIARFIELEGGAWLAKFDGTRASLDLYDSNHGNYCGKRDDCENWKSDIWFFINQF
jgi:hypothetical protein